MKHIKKPLNRSITTGCILFIIALCILLTMANLSIYKSFVYNDYRDYIGYILNYTMAHIDSDDLKTCIETKEESEKYKETLLFMDNLMEHFDDIHYFYSILPLNTDETGNVMSVLSAERYYDRYVDTEGNLFLGWISDDEFDSETASMLMDIMKGDSISFFEEATEWGTDYTGAVPIKDSEGNSIAVLAVDIDISFINEMITRYALINICIISIAGIIFIAIFLFWSRKNITMPIKQLEESAVGFANHSHGQRDVEALNFVAPEMKTDNEIKSLSDAVVKMTGDMRNYVYEIVNAEKKAANMRDLANRDALTGIRNKTAYDHEMKKLEAAIKNGLSNVALAVVDLNYLKKINDTYGHEKGNIAIKKLSDLICSTFAHSPVFRIGGDEFTIVLKGIDLENSDQLLERFQTELDNLSKDPALEPWEKVSAAIGIAYYDETIDDSLDSLFRRADHIMYDRKKEMKAERLE